MLESGIARLKPSALILGAGVSGLSVALTLLQHGHKVTMLDRGTAGGESSWAGGGILSPLLPWNYAEATSALALRSMACYAGWVTNIERVSELDVEFWRCGLLALDLKTPLQAMAWCTAHVIGANRRDESSIWLPELAQVRNPRLIDALRAAITKLGGTIYTESEVTAVTTSGAHLTGMHTAGGTFTADQFVLATGAWSGSLLPELESFYTQTGLLGSPNIRPIRGQMLLFKLQPGVLNTIVYRNGLYLIPRRDGHILVGSTLEDVGFDKSTDMLTRARLHAEAAELLPALASIQPIQHWAGLRPGSPDNIPIIGRHPDFDNVFVNTGHYRYGVTMAPASAELLVDLMEGKTPALDPTPYSWEAALARSWGDKL